MAHHRPHRETPERRADHTTAPPATAERRLRVVATAALEDGDAPPHSTRPPAPTRDPADEPLLRTLIGDVLRQARTEQGRTLREVAEAAQVSLPYLSEVERGRKEASSEVLAAVYHALGLRLVDLVGTLHAELSPTQRGSATVRPTTRPTTAPDVMTLAA